jgi:hypothetical protein
MMRRLISVAKLCAIALNLTSCIEEPDGVRYAVPAGAGGRYRAPEQPHSASGSRDLPAAIPNSYPMMEDPEEEISSWDEPIVAASPEEAERECKARAALYGLQVDRVQTPRQVRRGTNQQYRCWFKR